MTTPNRPIPELSHDDIDRFEARIKKATADECWPWLGCLRGGYGYMRVSGVQLKAHRLAYYIANGVDPKQQHVLHSCDNPACCNPNHLWLGDQRANNDDKESKGRGGHPVGVNNGASKLTAEQIVAIREQTCH